LKNSKVILGFNRISNNRLFVNFTTAIIVLYSVILGIRTFEDVYVPHEDLFSALDLLITLYFLIEISIRMISEEKIINFFKDGWNIFDFVIVAISLIPADNSEYAMIARMVRVFRVLRLITARPELKQIINVIIKAIPAIVDIVVLLFIVFYIYAIIGSFLFADTKSGLWDNFLIAMLTLFRILTFEDWTDVMYEAMEIDSWYWIYFVSFIIIAAFVLFNFFVAVIIEQMQNMHENKAAEELSQKIDDEDCHILELTQTIKQLNDKIDRLEKKIDEK
jgi:voltage-gated sodium channel